MAANAFFSTTRATGPDRPARDLRRRGEGQSTPEELLRAGFRFALSLTHDPSRAEDLLQDTSRSDRG